ncbi:MAG TPA: hypothetical protein VE152_04235, partial [Acidimicrobiales bacterium]|nr:hypothetical protein [Acidimicrobiales bacterium]
MGRIAPWRVVGLCSATVVALGTAALVGPRPATSWGSAPLRDPAPVRATIGRPPVTAGVVHPRLPGGQAGDAMH